MKSTPTISFAVALGVLTLLNLARADRVFWTKPSNNSNAYAGCDLDLGFRVQYSDMAMLAYVQLQVLDAENKVLIDNIDNSTRASWDDSRKKNVTWSVPQDWASGDYILRAFGDAFYPCTENGHRIFCRLQLEDRETFNVQHLMVGQTCPATKGSFAATSSPSPSSSLSSPSSLSNSGSESDSTSGSSSSLDSADTSKIAAEMNDTNANAPPAGLTPEMQSPLHIELDASVISLIRKNSVQFDQPATSENQDGSDNDLPKVDNMSEGEQQFAQQSSNNNSGSGSGGTMKSSSATRTGRVSSAAWAKIGSGASLLALTVATVLF